MLFTDGNPSRLEDLRIFESGIQEVASVEGIGGNQRPNPALSVAAGQRGPAGFCKKIHRFVDSGGDTGVAQMARFAYVDADLSGRVSQPGERPVSRKLAALRLGGR
jgi:hypothetical protein